jgi:hypothetical protein
LAERTRSAWAHLCRVATVPETEAEWEKLVQGLSSPEGPFDWSLCLGPRLRPGSGRPTVLGSLIDAYRHFEDEESGKALKRLAGGLLDRASAELGFDILAELPSGFESGKVHSFAELAAESESNHSNLWLRHLASAYTALPADAEVSDLALGLSRPVTGKRVLLTTLIYDRPELTSACVHLLRAHGASWVGLLALASA